VAPRRHLASLVAVAATLICGMACVGCAGQQNPYASNPNGRDPRPRPLDRRIGPPPMLSAVPEDFRRLPRPIVERYVKYEPTTRQASRGGNPPYTHIVLSDKACEFINRHTFDELLLALQPLARDRHWSGDVVAVIETASWAPWEGGRTLSRQE